MAELLFFLSVQLVKIKSNWLFVQLEAFKGFDLIVLAGGFDLVKVNIKLLIFRKQKITKLLQV